MNVVEINVLHTRAEAIRRFFELRDGARLLMPDVEALEGSAAVAAHVRDFNLEWHIIPTSTSVPFDEQYRQRMYPTAPATFEVRDAHGCSTRESLVAGHRQHQGRVVAVETTTKPDYSTSDRSFYGTVYGHDRTADPLTPYMDEAGFLHQTRYGHSFLSLARLVQLVDNDWRRRRVLPAGYHVSLCPPVIFNFIGTLFHPEWSATSSLELSFYMDARKDAALFVVGPNGPGDFSYVDRIETRPDWSMFGFRLALVPDVTGEETFHDG
jgi:hypothetical protein